MKLTVLDNQENAGLQTLMDGVRESIETAQIFRTRTEMEVSVLQDVKHPTPDSKYWQAVREQKVMYQELVRLSFDYEEKLIDLEETRVKMEAAKDFDLERLKIAEKRLIFLLDEMRQVAKDRVRELINWHDIKERLKPILKHGTGDVNRHQLESYSKRFERETAMLSEKSGMAERRNAIGLHETTQKKLKGESLFDQARVVSLRSEENDLKTQSNALKA